MSYHKYMKIKDIVHPSLNSERVENLMEYCKDHQILFADKEFPPSKESLIGNPVASDYDGKWKDISWSKASEIFNNDYDLFRGIEPSDIQQGALGDCYFLCALASLAEYPDLISRLFDYDQLTVNGIQSVWLNINGVWNRYILDEYFPTRKRKSRLELAFSKTDQNELWVLLLEKAYAKAYGSYWEIVGGDPVHALRDLTGAPYDRIEDFDQLDEAWSKLKEANAKQFMLTCFTKNTEIVEEESDKGIVSGHAYTILDVQNVIDSKGLPRRILQIRNPWGKFEWNGEFSDSSKSWSADDRKKLNIVERNDGVFWMTLEDFVANFQGVGVLQIIPGAVFNGTNVFKDKSSSNLTLARISLTQKTNLNLSINQMDSKTVDNPKYSNSYFRVTIGKLNGKKGIDFVDSKLSSERNIFLDNPMEAGDYIVLVEAYWENDLVRQFNIGSYSDYPVEIELLEDNDQVYLKSEFLIWKDFGLKNTDKMILKSERVADDGSNKADIKTFHFQNKQFAILLYNYVNYDEKNSVHDVLKFTQLKGFDVNGQKCNRGGAELLINPKDNDILLFKMDPRNKGYSLSHQIIQEEVIPYRFTDETKTIEQLNALGGKQPTPDNMDPAVSSRINKKDLVLEQRKQTEEMNRLREQTIIERQKRIEDNKRQLQEDLLKQQKQLEYNNRNEQGKINGLTGGLGNFASFFGNLDWEPSSFGGMHKPKRSLFEDVAQIGLGMLMGEKSGSLSNLIGNGTQGMQSMGNIMNIGKGMQGMGQGMQGMGNLMNMGQGMGNLMNKGQGMQGINNILNMGQGMQGMGNIMNTGQGMNNMLNMGQGMQGMSNMLNMGQGMQGMNNMMNMGQGMQGMNNMMNMGQGMQGMGGMNNLLGGEKGFGGIINQGGKQLREVNPNKCNIF